MPAPPGIDAAPPPEIAQPLADLERLAAMEHAVFTGVGGGGMDGGALATLDVAWRRPGGWPALPTVVGVGAWRQGGELVVPLSIGWRVELGAFEGPFAVADALVVWRTEAEADGIALGAEVGGGYEHRWSNRWSVVGEVRGVAVEGAGVGVRGGVQLRCYLGDFSFIDP